MQYEDDATPLNFESHGAQRYRGAVAHDLRDLCSALEHLPTHRAGIRISGIDRIQSFLAPHGSIGAIATRALGPSGRPVRAILFDKTAETN